MTQENEKIITLDILRYYHENKVLNRFTALEEQIFPFKITSFSLKQGSTVNQIGAEITPVLTWKFSPENTILSELALKKKDISTMEEQELTTDVAITSYEDTAISKTTVYTLNLTNQKQKTVTSIITIKFLNGIFYGAKEKPENYSGEWIRSLIDKPILEETVSRTITVTAGENEFIYYACPVKLAPKEFKVNGFSGGFELISNDIELDGSIYYIYKSDYSNLGETIIEIV